MNDLLEFEKYKIVKEAIIKQAGNIRGASGSIKCPLCGGRLRYEIASISGKIMASCSTNTCILMLE